MKKKNKLNNNNDNKNEIKNLYNLNFEYKPKFQIKKKSSNINNKNTLSNKKEYKKLSKNIPTTISSNNTLKNNSSKNSRNINNISNNLIFTEEESLNNINLIKNTNNKSSNYNDETIFDNILLFKQISRILELFNLSNLVNDNDFKNKNEKQLYNNKIYFNENIILSTKNSIINISENIEKIKNEYYFKNFYLKKIRKLKFFNNLLLKKIDKNFDDCIFLFIEIYPYIDNNLNSTFNNNKNTFLEDEKISVDLENEIKTSTIKFKKNFKTFNNKNNDLTPIPTKKSKSKKDEIEFISASRASYIIRRIEYSNYVSSGNKFYSKSMLNKITARIIFIQRWWREMLENNTFIYRIVLIQKFLRGYIIRKAYRMSKYLIKYIIPASKKITFIIFKKLMEKFINFFINKFGEKYIYNVIKKNVNFIEEQFKIYYKLNENIIKNMKVCKNLFNNNQNILKKYNNFKYIFQYKLFISNILLIQKKWRDFYNNIYKKGYKGKYHYIYLKLRNNKSKEYKTINKIFQIIIKNNKKKFINYVLNNYKNIKNLEYKNKTIKKLLLFIENKNLNFYFKFYKNKIYKIKNLNKIKQTKIYNIKCKINKKIICKYINKWKKNLMKILSYSIIIIKHILLKKLKLYFDNLFYSVYYNPSKYKLKNNKIINPIYFITKNSEIINLLNKIFINIKHKEQNLLKIKLYQFLYITKIKLLLNDEDKKLNINQKNLIQRQKKIIIKKIINKIEVKNYWKLKSKLRRWRRLNFYLGFCKKYKLFLLLNKFFLNKN